MKPVGPLVSEIRTSEIHVSDYDDQVLFEAYSEYFGDCPGCGDMHETTMTKAELVTFFEQQRVLVLQGDRLGLMRILDELRGRILCNECARRQRAA